MANSTANTWYYGSWTYPYQYGHSNYDGSATRAAIKFAISSPDNSSSSTITLSGATNFYEYTGWSGSWLKIDGEQVATSLGPASGTSGNSTVYTRTKTVTRTHSAQTKTYTVVSNNGANDSSVSVSVSVPALKSYTVSFNANSGSGAPASQTKWYGETLTLSTTVPTRTGYKFLGWATSSTATSATYSAGGSYTANSGTTLYAVWEAQASPIDSAANITLGGKANIKWTPLSTAFQYKIKLAIGSWSYTTADYITVSSTSQQTWNTYTVAVDPVANQITTSTVGTATATLYTYSGTTLLGSATKTFTVTVPSSTKPAFTTAPNAVPYNSNSTVNGWGIFLAGYSQATLTGTATAYYGAKLTKIEITGGVATSVTGNATTLSVNYRTPSTLTSGTKTFTFVATDSRGLTSDPVTKTISVYAYSAPTITTFTATRGTGALANKITALGNWTFPDLGNHNSATAKLFYKLASDASYTQYGSLSKNTSTTLTNTYAEGSTYSFKLTVTDALGNATSAEVTVSTISVWMSMPANGQGVAFGKVSETGNFEINYPLEVNGNVTSTGSYIGAGSVEFIRGKQGSSTNAWTGVTKDKALYDGKMIMYVLPYAGTSTGATMNLTLAGGGTTGAKPIYRYGGTTQITTHYAAGSRILMIYDADNQRWNSSAWYYSDSNNKVAITAVNPASETTYYPLMYTATSGTVGVNAYAYLRHWIKKGTADSVGYDYLGIGNNVATGTENNSYGCLRLYGYGTKYAQVRYDTDANATENTDHYLPETSGTLLNTGIVKDYVVEEGTWLSGKYVKWNSGMAECYGYTSLTSAISSRYGTSGICYKDTSVTFPSALFKSGTAPTVDITMQRNGGLLWPSIHSLSNTSVAFYIGSATAEPSSTIYIHVIAKGVWK